MSSVPQDTGGTFGYLLIITFFGLFLFAELLTLRLAICFSVRMFVIQVKALFLHVQVKNA